MPSHNDGISDDELYVAACYADEGATMKRFRPRARGRASRINKRTSHVTIIVARYDADDLDARREKAATQGSTSAAQAEARRRRVQQSQGVAADDNAEDMAETQSTDDTTATTEEE